MSKSAEQIKAFLSDEKKIAQFANDGEFMDKVAGGTATAKRYSDEFEKFSLELSDEESKKVKQTTTELLNMPIEKLADLSLERISGGTKKKAEPEGEDRKEESVDGSTTSTVEEDGVPGMGRFVGGSLVVGAGLLGALGCSVAGLVCQRNASKAMLQGDMVKSAKYSKAAKGLAMAASSCAGGGIIGFGVGASGLLYTLLK